MEDELTVRLHQWSPELGSLRAQMGPSRGTGEKDTQSVDLMSGLHGPFVLVAVNQVGG